MARNYLLLSYLILILIPSLESLPVGGNVLEPLLKLSYKKLDHIEDGESEIILPTDSFRSFQAERPKANRGDRGDIQSILKTATGRFRTFFTPQTSESKVLASWEVCYDISAKVFESSQSPEVKRLATAVLKLGPRFSLHQYGPQDIIEHFKSTLDFSYLALEIDSLSTAERLWSVGVLSYLRSRSPGYRNWAIPGLWTANDMTRPRGDFLLFLLQDRYVGNVIRDLWLESPSETETSEQVIQEAIRRESTVHFIKNQMRLPGHHPSASFHELYLAFINLKTPIDVGKASSLMRSIKDRLSHSKKLMRIGFDEDANIVRLLLHLEENHYQSYPQFTALINNPQSREKILQNDIRFQLSDEKLPENVIDLLKEFQNIRTVNEQQIPKILDILNQEQMSISQLGRFFRVLTLSFAGNHQMYESFQLQLGQHSEMVPRLFERLLKYRHGRITPGQFEWGALEYLVFLKNEDQVMKKYRNGLADELLSRGVLSKDEIVKDEQDLPEATKQLIIDQMLYTIFKNMAAARISQHNLDTDHKLIEYILHLISFKNDDKMLYRLFLAPKSSPETLPIHQTTAFRALSETVSVFLDNRSWWDHDGQLNGFRKSLKLLEEQIHIMEHQIPRIL